MRPKIGIMIRNVTYADHRSGKDGIMLEIFIWRKEWSFDLIRWKHNRPYNMQPVKSFSSIMNRPKSSTINDDEI